MKHRAALCVFLFALLLVVSGCNSDDDDSNSDKKNPTAAPETTVTLTVSGSGSVQTILSAVEAVFEKDTPGYHLDILSGSGTDGGVQGVTDGTLTVAAMARPPKDEELEKAPTFQYVEFGRGPHTLLVHPELGITELTTEQAVSILTGEITNWSEVGGPDMAIVLYIRDESDSSTKALRKACFGENVFAESAQILTSQGDMAAAVSSTPGSLGFGAWTAMLALKSDVTGIALDGIKPADTNYPILEPMGIGYLAAQEETVQPFIDWLLSEAGQAALAEFGLLAPVTSAS